MNFASAQSCVIAFIISVVLTPFVRQLCIRFGVFDPLGPLKIHQRPIPRLGGVAIALAIVAASLFSRSLPTRMELPFFVSLALVWIVGLIDDIRRLSPLTRMAAQTIAALLLWRAGWHFPMIENHAWNAVATCFFVITFCNAFNFLDGSDGLAAGVAGVIALAFALARPTTGAYSGAVSCALLGATTGFLVFNAPLPRASIFMGDSGSTALGFTIAVVSLTFSQFDGATPSSLLFAILVAGIPLFDAALAVVRRVRDAQSPLTGDRRHFYDLLRKRGWPTRKIALVSYAATGLLAIIGWIGLRLEVRYFAALTAAAFTTLFAVALRLGSLRPDVEPLPRVAHSARIDRNRFVALGTASSVQAKRSRIGQSQSS